METWSLAQISSRENKLRKIPVLSKLNAYLAFSRPDFPFAYTAMKDYYELESVLLAVQLRHIDFFEDDQSLIIDYVTIDVDRNEFITLRDLPDDILNDLNATLSEQERH
jgi:hypothetical protein